MPRRILFSVKIVKAALGVFLCRGASYFQKKHPLSLPGNDKGWGILLNKIYSLLRFSSQAILPACMEKITYAYTTAVNTPIACPPLMAKSKNRISITSNSTNITLQIINSRDVREQAMCIPVGNRVPLIIAVANVTFVSTRVKTDNIHPPMIGIIMASAVLYETGRMGVKNLK